MTAVNAPRGELRSQVSLAPYTTWRVGGRAKQCYRPATVEDLGLFLSQLPMDEPLLWLGLGSNLLIRDGGFEGTVILTHGSLSSCIVQNDTLWVGAGVPCAKIAKQAVKANLTGGEFWAGIPGTFGGALAMNAGAWGGTTWEWVTRIQTLDRKGNLHHRVPSDYDIGYRHVRGPADEGFVGATIKLLPGDGTKSAERIKALLQQRNQTQPTHLPSCGSVFRNPPGDHAARLIEQAGLKGFAIGDAQVSLKHANFIVNRGCATASQLEQVIHHIIATVHTHFGVILHPEVRIVGRACHVQEVIP